MPWRQFLPAAAIAAASRSGKSCRSETTDRLDNAESPLPRGLAKSAGHLARPML